MNVKIREVIDALKHPRHGLYNARGYGSAYRVLRIEENVAKMEAILSTADEAVKRTKEYANYSADESRFNAETVEADAKYRQDMKKPKAKDGADVNKDHVVPVSRGLVDALTAKDREIQDTEVEFNPTLFDLDLVGEVTIDDIGESAKPDRREALARVNRSFYAFVARFKAMKPEGENQ
jgi:hypothetical protein